MIYGKTPINLLNDTRISFNDLRVYVALASFQGKNPDCNSSQKKISERSGVFVSHISKHTKRLQRYGWLEIKRRGKKMSNRYIIKSDISESGESLKDDIPESGMSDIPKSGESIVKEHLKLIIDLAKSIINRVDNEKILYSTINKFLGLLDIEKILRSCIKRGLKFDNENRLAAYLQACIKSNGGNSQDIPQLVDTLENDEGFNKWQKERKTV
jgi:DNA-binding MarR family transcriptional regulator